MDSEQFLGVMIVALVLVGIFFIALIVAGVYKAKTVTDNMKSDDEKPLLVIKGKVLEKIVDTQHVKGAFEYDVTIEWIVMEAVDGTRRKVRNTKPKEILIATGDSGEFTLRGETIYDFKRTVN